SPGRLYKTMVESKKATSAGGVALGRRDPGLLVISARVDDPTQTGAARDAMLATVEAVADRPVTADEVDRAMKRLAVAWERAQADAETMADQLDEFIALGDWRLFFWERDQTAAVTAADVNRVAARYLTRNNRTVGVYYATPKPERVEIPEDVVVSKVLDGYAGRAAKAPAATFDPTPEKIEERVTRGTLGPIKTAFLPKPGPLARVRLTLRYGNEQALVGRTVAAEVVPAMLQAGTKTRTRRQLGDELTKLGAGMSVTGGAGILQVTVSAKRPDLPAVLAIVRDVLREPAFPADEFDTMKRNVLAALTAAKADPDSLAAEALRRKLQSSPKTDIRYQPTTDEVIERVKALTVGDVKAVYADLVGADAGELVAIGDIDPAAVSAGLEPALKGWTSKVPYARVAVAATPVAKGETVRLATPDKANAIYQAGLTFPMTDADPDYPALLVGTQILGGDPVTSRLGDRVRKRGGLSYHVGAVFDAAAADPSATFLLVATTNPANMGKVTETIAAELKAFLDAGVTADELAAAKKGILEQMKLLLADDGIQLDALSNGLLYGRTFARQAGLRDAIERLTPADIQRAFRKAVDPAKLVIVEAGDFAKAETQVGAKAGR
ncbi:MAG TPA: insulinase family protein, partial [Gemmataceae bacterium]|nr:insulinase family protein [Gemmataceae bacterium]